jgi:SAM-dependent methyltransferase
MFAEGTPPGDLHYGASRSLFARGSKLRQLLRAAHLEGAARAVAQAYRAFSDWLAPGNPAHPSFWLHKVADALPPGPRAVLDLGGGDGAYRAVLSSAHDEYVILEANFDSDHVKKGLARHRYVIGDGHDRVFRPGSFDVIAMFEVLEHVRNPFRIFENCASWLSPGGVLVLSTPQYWHVHGWPNDYFRYTSFGLRELARTAGLEVVELWPMGGPCVLIWCAVELNFGAVLRLPVIQQLVTFPTLVLARAMDRLLFFDNTSRANPDSRGWMMIARRPPGPIAAGVESR